LNEELNHRVKNILALIKSLVSQPVEDGRAISEYVETLKGRIMALSNAHDQVIRNDGGGALKTLLEAELSPYRARRISLDGQMLGLDARAYSVLALVVHELATNAAKYGALSVKEGGLFVEWRIEEAGDLVLEWSERGGPPVMAPKRKGFGSVLLNRSIPFDLGGEAQVNYDFEGLNARLRIPARFVSLNIGAGEEEEIAARVQEETERGLKQRHVLLVEDQLVIAIDVETMLSAAGADPIDTAATAAEALRILSSARPDIGVLDVNLGSGTSLPVADELIKRGVPFIFATGYGDRAIIPARLAHVPVIRKPYDSETLTQALTALGRSDQEDAGEN
jgi:two-component sensor histidine kinase/CheY-like chemotaxis protein